MSPPPKRCISSGSRGTPGAELGRLCNLQASVPDENTGPLVQKQEKSVSCGFLTCHIFF